MRVFCPQHKIGFFAPRKNPIRCENHGHVLGEVIFHGDTKVPETFWQYCCNCGHFCPVELNHSGFECCPACGRRISQMYACDHCFTFSFESSTPIQTKNFTLTSDGTPQPSCPGCLQEAAGDLREHDCDELGARFITALNTCPVCLEQFDVGPTFPASVTQYLKKIKAANKLTVTFDYATGLFVPSDKGEFVLVSNTNQETGPFVLPRSLRFESKDDFYDLYQDYYHCSKVRTGELHVIEPALVQRVGGGWKLQSMGLLELVNAEPETDTFAEASVSDSEFPTREGSTFFSETLTEEPAPARQQPRAAIIEKPPSVACPNCGSFLDSTYVFCWNCGHSTHPVAVASKEANKTRLGSYRILTTDDESTIQRSQVDIQPPILLSVLSEPSRSSSITFNVRLIAVVVGGLLLLTLAGFLLKGPLSQFGRSADAQQVSSNFHSGSDSVPRADATTKVVVEPKAQPNLTVDTAEQDLRELSEKRVGASASDRPTLLQLFASSEKQHPRDYRFPYESAKVVINDRETKAHHDAFDALSRAAEEAIKTGKAREMLERLQADKFGDFHKLAHGHYEWTQIIEALKTEDVTLLPSN